MHVREGLKQTHINITPCYLYRSCVIQDWSKGWIPLGLSPFPPPFDSKEQTSPPQRP